MDQEKNTNQTPEQEPYVPASRGKRIAAWIGVIFMVALVLMYSYSIATGAFLLW
jgi:hypothetical protein